MQRNFCFGCGKSNPEGLRLKFTYDEKRKRYVSRFRLAERFCGPPGHAHGGIIATILDEAMGKMNKVRDAVAVTAEMTVHYLKPVRLGKPLRVEAREVKIDGRRRMHAAEILDSSGQVLAKSEGMFIAVDAERMFGKYVKK